MVWETLSPHWMIPPESVQFSLHLCVLCIINAMPICFAVFSIQIDTMKKVNKQCLLDTPHTVRVSEKT